MDLSLSSSPHANRVVKVNELLWSAQIGKINGNLTNSTVISQFRGPSKRVAHKQSCLRVKGHDGQEESVEKGLKMLFQANLSLKRKLSGWISDVHLT